MPGHLLLAAAIGFGPGPGPDALTIDATLDATELAVGQTYTITLNVAVAAGYSAGDAGIPKPILQVDVPPAVELAGERVESGRAFARNEFLSAPFERMVDVGATEIVFTLAAAPAGDDVIALNVVAYLRETANQDAWFVRRRIELPLTPGAASRPADPTVTTWGADRATLNVGDAADPFTLPQAGGAELALADYRGKKNVIVTTYRAFW